MNNIISAITGVYLLGTQMLTPLPAEHLLAQSEMSLNNRYAIKVVNDVFKDNILLSMAYMDEKVGAKDQINWDEVRKPFKYEFKLDPNQTFAYHEDVLPEYEGKVVKTSGARFNAQEGFQFSGFLFGDGVCHLASLMYLVAKEAGLDSEAPTNHNFAQIPQIPKEYGVSIYSMPGAKGSNARQNLYITNNHQKPVTFKFDYQNDKLKLSIFESE